MKKLLRTILFSSILLSGLFFITGCVKNTNQNQSNNNQTQQQKTNTPSPTLEADTQNSTTSEKETDNQNTSTEDNINDTIHLDPALTTNEDSLKINSYLYEGLTKLDAAGSPVPGIARSWIISDDVLDYIFELRADVVFTDGIPVNADLVLTNFNRWFDPEHPLHNDASYPAWETHFLGYKGEKEPDGQPKPSFDGIEKIDNLTILIHLNRQVPDLLEILAHPSFSILNPNILEAEMSRYGTIDGSAIGTGPYLLSEWSENQLILDPNPNYWGDIPEESITFSIK